MQRQGNTYTLEREKALADGLRDVAAELRLIDAADLIAFIRTEQFANIANLVNSSTELYYKPGTLSFGRSGDIDVEVGRRRRPSRSTWNSTTCRSASTSACCWRRCRPAIEINYIGFESAARPIRTENTQRLIAAIANASIWRPISWRALSASMRSADERRKLRTRLSR